MRFNVKNSSRDNPVNFMRRLGYIHQRYKTDLAFIRPLERSGYPRFHIYLKQEKTDKMVIDLHLDQKRPIYKGVKAHSGEYDGSVVEKEAERIQNQLKT